MGLKKQKNSLHSSMGLGPRVLLQVGTCNIHRTRLTLKAFEARCELKLSKVVIKLQPSLTPDKIKVFNLLSQLPIREKTMPSLGK